MELNCSLCKEAFSSQALLKNHLKSIQHSRMELQVQEAEERATANRALNTRISSLLEQNSNLLSLYVEKVLNLGPVVEKNPTSTTALTRSKRKLFVGLLSRICDQIIEGQLNVFGSIFWGLDSDESDIDLSWNSGTAHATDPATDNLTCPEGANEASLRTLMGVLQGMKHFQCYYVEAFHPVLRVHCQLSDLDAEIAANAIPLETAKNFRVRPLSLTRKHFLSLEPCLKPCIRLVKSWAGAHSLLGHGLKHLSTFGSLSFSQPRLLLSRYFLLPNSRASAPAGPRARLLGPSSAGGLRA